jgi:hypothetical protein
MFTTQGHEATGSATATKRFRDVRQLMRAVDRLASLHDVVYAYCCEYASSVAHVTVPSLKRVFKLELHHH